MRGDLAGGRAPLSPFWRAARELDHDAPGEAGLPGTRAGHLRELFEEAGLADVEEGELSVTVEHASFEEWWEPFTLGVGPAGAYVAGLGAEPAPRCASAAACSSATGRCS